MYLSDSLTILLPPLAIWLAVSGIDDLVLFALWIYLRLSERGAAAVAVPNGGPERNIAIFTPLWQEEAVVRQMVAHNVTAIQYSRFHIFIGA